jgi:hypothetical protein
MINVLRLSALNYFIDEFSDFAESSSLTGGYSPGVVKVQSYAVNPGRVKQGRSQMKMFGY